MIDPLPPPVRWAARRSALRQRCAGVGQFKNGGTYPASSTLENSGVSLVRSGTSTTTFLQVDHGGSQPRVDRHARRRQHAAAHPAHQLRQQERPAQRGAAGGRDHVAVDGVVGLFYFDEDSFDRLLVPLGNPGTSYDTQRVSMDSRRRRRSPSGPSRPPMR
jgi:iron complex outermembrane receptor protein